MFAAYLSGKIILPHSTDVSVGHITCEKSAKVTCATLQAEILRATV